MKLKMTIIIIIFIFLLNPIFSEKNSKTRLGINKLTTHDVDEKKSLEIITKLYSKLKNLKGERIIFRVKDGISKSVNRQLYGRINKFGKGFVLNINIVEGEKGKLLYSKTVIIKDYSKIDDILEEIAEEINDKNEIW